MVHTGGHHKLVEKCELFNVHIPRKNLLVILSNSSYQKVRKKMKETSFNFSLVLTSA